MQIVPPTFKIELGSLLLSEVLVGISIQNLLFAIPAKILIALRAVHFIAPINFFNRGVACRTRPKLEPVALSIQVEVEGFFAFASVPHLAAFEARRLRTSSAHGSVATTAGLVQQRIAIWRGAILNSFA